MAKDVTTGTKPTGSFKFIDGPGMNMPRDNSGGPSSDGGEKFQCSATFGDGGDVTGSKAHLSKK